MAKNTEILKDNVEVMTKHFNNAMVFEQYVKIWTDSLNFINSKIDNNQVRLQDALSGMENEQYRIESIDNTYYEQINNIKQKKRKHQIIVLAIVIISMALLIAGIVLSYQGNIIGSIMLIPFMTLIPFILFIIVCINIYNIAKCSKEIKNYGAENKQYQKEVSKNNINSYNIFVKKLDGENAALLSKKAEIIKQLNESKRILVSIYSEQLIPKRYQGLIPVSTIYGYLETGRCNMICGHGGVYDTYEKDLQAGIIINNLIEINRKLNIVINNQQKLYKVLQSIDSTVSSIKSEVENSGRKLDEIKKNSAIAATAASQSAAASSYVAYEVWRNN